MYTGTGLSVALNKCSIYQDCRLYNIITIPPLRLKNKLDPIFLI